MQKRSNLTFFVIIFMLCTSCFMAFKPINKKVTNFNLSVYYDTTAFAKAKDTILYMPSKPLVWDNFKAKPLLKNQTVAESSVGFKYDADIQQSEEKIIVKIKISTFFIKTKSWKKSEEISNYILQHEQKHFDLARYGAQIFADEIAAQKMNLDNFNQVLQKTYNKAWQQYVLLQQQYDVETNHSINTIQQNKWNTLIENYLRKCN